MEKFITVFTIIMFLFLAATAYADESIGIRWDASTGDVVGYKVYYNDNSKLCSTTSMLFSKMGLIPGVLYTFSVTAYNNAGESGHSNTVEYTPPVFIITEDPSTHVINIPAAPNVLILNFNQSE